MFKKVYVEITNNCNLKCPFCISNKRDKKFISLDEFSNVINKLKGFTNYLYFHVMGEPLLHPKVNDLINLAFDNGFNINLTTNGYLIDRIVNNKNIRQVNISLHSFHENNGVSLEDYINNIFCSVDNLVNNGTYVVYRLWVNSIYRDVILDKLNNKYNVNIGDNKSIKLSDNVYFEVAEEFIWPSLDNDYYEENGSCMGCRTHIGILVDGTVVPCCLDSAGIINLGNIYKQDLNDIIGGENFINLKNGFLNNKKIHELCKKCNFYDLRK